MSSPDPTWLTNVKATAKKVQGVTAGNNTLIFELGNKVTYESRKIIAHLTITYQDLWSAMSSDDDGTSVDTLIAAMNNVDYHVTFRLGDDDYDSTNPKWWSNTKTYSGKGEAAAFNSDTDIEEEREAVLTEAASVTFKKL